MFLLLFLKGGNIPKASMGWIGELSTTINVKVKFNDEKLVW